MSSSQSGNSDVNQSFGDSKNISQSPPSPHWPEIVQGQKIPTKHFLQGCETIVQVVGAMGTFMSPVKSDMEGNVQKLKKALENNPAQYEYIEDLVLIEKGIRDSKAVDALLWLKRALTFIYVLLDKIVKDADHGITGQDITGHYSDSYSNTLSRYHNWFLQKSFMVCIKCGSLPDRRGLLMSMPTSHGSPPGISIENLVKDFKPFFYGFQQNITAVITFYHAQKLDTVSADSLNNH